MLIVDYLLDLVSRSGDNCIQAEELHDTPNINTVQITKLHLQTKVSNKRLTPKSRMYNFHLASYLQKFV